MDNILNFFAENKNIILVVIFAIAFFDIARRSIGKIAEAAIAIFATLAILAGIGVPLGQISVQIDKDLHTFANYSPRYGAICLAVWDGGKTVYEFVDNTIDVVVDFVDGQDDPNES